MLSLIFEEGLYDRKNLQHIDAFYPDMFSVCGESESDGEMWYRLGPGADHAVDTASSEGAYTYIVFICI